MSSERGVVTVLEGDSALVSSVVPTAAAVDSRGSCFWSYWVDFDGGSIVASPSVAPFEYVSLGVVETA